MEVGGSCWGPDLPEGALGEEELVEAHDGGGVEDEEGTGGGGDLVEEREADAEGDQSQGPEGELRDGEEEVRERAEAEGYGA